MKSKFTIPAILLLFFIAVSGSLLLFFLSQIISTIVTGETDLKNGSLLYQQWREPTIPIFLQFYVFNLTNPVEFMNGSRPQVSQIGPYTYMEKRTKENITFDNETVSFNEVVRYYFQPSLSSGSEADVVTTINLIYVFVATYAKNLPSFILFLIEQTMKEFGDHLISEESVGEFLWGRDDPLLDFLKKLGIPVPMRKVGLYVGKNNTDPGRFEINTGKYDRRKLGKIVKFRDRNSSTCWKSWAANQFNGTDGSLFRPFLNFDNYVDIFSSEICRSLRFTAREATTVQNIPAFKYLAMEESFESPANNSNNIGFCPRWPTCLDDGLLDMTTCTPGLPIVISLPHFLSANPSYADAVEGIHPSTEYNTTFYINPLTGVLLKAAKKLQINLNITQNSKFSELSKIRSVLLPLMFINESVSLDASSANRLYWSLVLIPTTAKVSLGVVVCVCVLAASVLIALLLKHRFSMPSSELTKPLIGEPIAT